MRLPLQELEFQNEADVYVLGNFHTKPAWWYVSHTSIGLAKPCMYERRSLKNIIILIEQLYPDFYAWLVLTFPSRPAGTHLAKAKWRITAMVALVKHSFLIVGLALTLAPVTAGIELVVIHDSWHGIDAVAYVASFVVGACLLWFRYLLRERAS